MMESSDEDLSNVGENNRQMFDELEMMAIESVGLLNNYESIEMMNEKST